MKKVMKCPNCKKDLVKINADVYECLECKELFNVADNKAVLVTDKESAVNGVVESVRTVSEKCKEFANRHGFTVEDEEDNGVFGF